VSRPLGMWFNRQLVACGAFLMNAPPCLPCSPELFSPGHRAESLLR
jgi:hypothetical protein